MIVSTASAHTAAERILTGARLLTLTRVELA